MITKILVALDGSEPSDKAFDYALDLAHKYSADIELLSVLHIDPRVYTLIPSIDGEIPVSVASMDKYITRIEASHKKVLLKALKKAKQRVPNVKVSTSF